MDDISGNICNIDLILSREIGISKHMQASSIVCRCINSATPFCYCVSGQN